MAETLTHGFISPNYFIHFLWNKANLLIHEGTFYSWQVNKFPPERSEVFSTKERHIMV